MNLFLIGIIIFVIVYLFLNWFARTSSKKIATNIKKFTGQRFEPTGQLATKAKPITTDDYTGSYIITFWIISINVILYYNLGNKVSSKKRISLILTALGFVLIGWIRILTYEPVSESLDIAVIQPNIDPNEKWDNNNRTQTLNLMDSLYNEAIILEPDIILFP